MESNQSNSPKVFLSKGQGKDKHFQTQMKQVFLAFYKEPKTMLMVSLETGILRANICRYIDIWQKRSCIVIVKKIHCKISKYRAGYYTTNAKEVVKLTKLNCKQLNLFE